MKTPSRQTGFTLVELALVLLVIGILMAGLLQPLRAGFEQARRAEARRDLGAIREALFGYAANQSPPRLPCPDCRGAGCASQGNQADDGLEDRHAGNGSCDSGARPGNLPWATLGTVDADPWGSRYSYRVAPDFASAPGFGLNAGPNGTLSIYERDGQGQPSLLASHIPVLFMSQGANRAGATSRDGGLGPAPAGDDERENLDADRRYMAGSPRTPAAAGGGGAFDDQLAWIGIYELNAFLIRAGVLP